MSAVKRGIIDRIMQDAFSNRTRTPRSTAYKDGCRAALSYRFEGRRIEFPYRIGTAEADAFFAGIDEGHQRFREHCEARAVGASSGAESAAA